MVLQSLSFVVVGWFVVLQCLSFVGRGLLIGSSSNSISGLLEVGWCVVDLELFFVVRCR